jgi:hypothetical protein
MAWIKNGFYVLIFSLGCLFTATIYKVRDIYSEYDCGYMRGYTTHVTYENESLICIWRQNSWPFKTISGVKV